MHIVYKITFKTSGKSYIGYTSKGILERIHVHMTNASRGLDSHFYRALRLYGIEDCVFETLFSSEDKDSALAEEKRLIRELDAIKSGYNSCDGGIGGFNVPDSKYARWKEGLSTRAKGNNNPNYSGLTDQEILSKAVDYYVSNSNRLIPARWKEYSKKHGLPQSYSKCRFGGTVKGFIEALKSELDKQNIPYNKNSFKLTKEERYAKNNKTDD